MLTEADNVANPRCTRILNTLERLKDEARPLRLRLAKIDARIEDHLSGMREALIEAQQDGEAFTPIMRHYYYAVFSLNHEYGEPVADQAECSNCRLSYPHHRVGSECGACASLIEPA